MGEGDGEGESEGEGKEEGLVYGGGRGREDVERRKGVGKEECKKGGGDVEGMGDCVRLFVDLISIFC